jgi:hypothetical protein
VIAIIAILAALLLPVLSGARLKAHQIACLGNLRQMGQVAFMYHQDYGKGVPYGMTSQALMWSRTMPTNGASYNAAMTEIRLCPAAKCPKTLASDGGIHPWGNPGTAANCWSVGTTGDAGEDASGSYAYNGWFYSGGGFKTEPEQYFPNYSSVRYAPKTPVFADGVWFDVQPNVNNAAASDLFTGDVLDWTAGARAIGCVTIGRHGSKPPGSAPRSWPLNQPLPRTWGVNVAFADGRAGLVKLPDLWSLTWSRGWSDGAKPPVHP